MRLVASSASHEDPTAGLTAPTWLTYIDLLYLVSESTPNRPGRGSTRLWLWDIGWVAKLPFGVGHWRSSRPFSHSLCVMLGIYLLNRDVEAWR